LPVLRRLVAPAVLEEVADGGVSNCPQLTEMILGEAPLRRLGNAAFGDDFSLESLSLSLTLVDIGRHAFTGTAIASLDASECPFLNAIALSSLQTFCDLILPPTMLGVLSALYTTLVLRATFGSISLDDDSYDHIIFGELRFGAFRPPQGGFVPEMFARASIESETASVLDREAAPARPP
jgi:hypothetical protein